MRSTVGTLLAAALACVAATAALAAGTIDLIALLDGKIRTANASTDVPILLPEAVPATVPQARMKVVTRAGAARYEFEIALTRSCHHRRSCEIGFVSGHAGGKAGPAGGRRDLSQRVTLLDGLRGFYKVGTPAEIQWVENSFLYDIAWKAPKGEERRTIIELANLAIRGGVRS